MNVAEADRDPFFENESDWPLRHYEELYMVTTTFSTQDPPLLTPLLTSSARAQAIRAHGGHCLNCNGTDHSMQNCPQDFINISGNLNPALGQLNNGGHANRQWQQRMRSYRRGQYEHNVERNSNRYAHRNDNRGGTYHNNNRGANNNNNRCSTTTPTNTGAATDAPTTDATTTAAPTTTAARTTTAAPTTTATDSRKGRNFNIVAPPPHRSRQP